MFADKSSSFSAAAAAVECGQGSIRKFRYHAEEPKITNADRDILHASLGIVDVSGDGPECRQKADYEEEEVKITDYIA
jgi:hypothetical protein